jgi:hypothetical protein
VSCRRLPSSPNADSQKWKVKAQVYATFGQNGLVKSKMDGCAFLWLSSSGANGLRCQLLTTSLCKNWKYYRNDSLTTYSLSAFVLAIIILCLSVPSADTYAQEAAPAALKMPAHPTLWLLDEARSDTTPHLLIGMADREDPRYHGLPRLARDEATNRSATDSIPGPLGSMASVNRAEEGAVGPVVLSRLFEPPTGVGVIRDFYAEDTIPSEILQSSPDRAGPKIYSLLNDRPPFESFLYGDQMKHLLPKQLLANRELFTPGMDHAPLPLLHLGFGGWQLPIVLSAGEGLP